MLENIIRFYKHFWSSRSLRAAVIEIKDRRTKPKHILTILKCH